MIDKKENILKMIEDGKVTAADGARLLQTIDKTTLTADPISSVEPPRWFHVQVTNTQTNLPLVDITIPMELVMTGMHMGAQFAPNVEQEQLIKAIEAAEQGKKGILVNYTDQSRMEHIEIYVA